MIRRTAKEHTMDPVSFFLWLPIGGVIGWLASLAMYRDARQSILQNILVGIAGAFGGGFLLTRFLAAFLAGWPLAVAPAVAGAVGLLLVFVLVVRGCGR